MFNLEGENHQYGNREGRDRRAILIRINKIYSSATPGAKIARGNCNRIYYIVTAASYCSYVYIYKCYRSDNDDNDNHVYEEKQVNKMGNLLFEQLNGCIEALTLAYVSTCLQFTFFQNHIYHFDH